MEGGPGTRSGVVPQHLAQGTEILKYHCWHQGWTAFEQINCPQPKGLFSSGLGASSSVLIVFLPPQRSFAARLWMLMQSAERDAATDVHPFAFGFCYSWPPKQGKFCCWHEQEQKQVLFLETLSSFECSSPLLNAWEGQVQEQNT